MPLSLIKLSFKFLPLIVFQLVEIRRRIVLQTIKIYWFEQTLQHQVKHHQFESRRLDFWHAILRMNISKMAVRRQK